MADIQDARVYEGFLRDVGRIAPNEPPARLIVLPLGVNVYAGGRNHTCSPDEARARGLWPPFRAGCWGVY